MTSPDTTTSQPWTQSDDTFAARLALIRWRKGWNIKEAARACGLPPATWRMWELDGSLPRNQVSTAKKIADTAGCDYYWLLFGPDRPTPPAIDGDLSGQRVIATIGEPRQRTHRPVTRTRPTAKTRALVSA